jgi:hypothetical protein
VDRLTVTLVTVALLLASGVGCGQREQAPAARSQEEVTGIRGVCSTLTMNVERPDSETPAVQSQATDGVTIVVRNQESRRIVATLTSDSNGRFQLPVRPGVYEVMAISPPVFTRVPTQVVEVIAGTKAEVNLEACVPGCRADPNAGADEAHTSRHNSDS